MRQQPLRKFTALFTSVAATGTAPTNRPQSLQTLTTHSPRGADQAVVLSVVVLAIRDQNFRATDA